MQISKSKLKSKLLEILKEVESENTEVIVTDRDKLVAKISKFQNVPTTEKLFQDLRGQVKYFEDPTTSTREEWGDEIWKLFWIPVPYFGGVLTQRNFLLRRVLPLKKWNKKRMAEPPQWLFGKLRSRLRTKN